MAFWSCQGGKDDLTRPKGHEGASDRGGGRGLRRVSCVLPLGRWWVRFASPLHRWWVRFAGPLGWPVMGWVLQVRFSGGGSGLRVRLRPAAGPAWPCRLEHPGRLGFLSGRSTRATVVLSDRSSVTEGGARWISPA